MRSLDSACNPYLAFSVLLAAGMKGVQDGYELPPGAEDEVWSLSDTELRALGYAELPHNLADAVRAMESSELVAETLGEHVFDFFIRNKREEWTEYRAEVSPFELRRYLPAL
jgi:glutamine synthetase